VTSTRIHLAPAADRNDAVGSLADHYFSYLSRSDEQLQTELCALIEDEHALPEPRRYEATLGRLRAWLELSAEDARIVARSYAAALSTYPEEYALETQAAERDVILNAMTFEEFKQLAEVIPWLCSGDWYFANEPLAEPFAA
jgi:hypothetical protein